MNSPGCSIISRGDRAAGINNIRSHQQHIMQYSNIHYTRIQNVITTG